MKLNIIHRADAGPRSRETLSFQLAAALQRGLKATVLVSYSGLQDSSLVRMLRSEYEPQGVEMGIHFHSMLCDTFEQKFRTSCPAFYLLPRQTKQSVLQEFFSQFADELGKAPQAIGGYILDAWTLRFVRTHFPSVISAITTCFEEGVKMYQGNNHGWTLFNDGGPWGPYYPSRENVLCPARDHSDAIGILGLPHLNRDMLLSLTHRDDLFASHPINLMRAGITAGDRAPYMDRFVQQWIDQEPISSCTYYSLFVSTPWLTDGHPFITSIQDARGLYERNLDDLSARKNSGEIEDMTMSEFASWHGQEVGFQTDACLWRDIISGSPRQMFWYVSPSFRAAVDLNAGGALVDLRPLAGRVNRDLGPDTDAQWNGNYPYLISSELRGGFGRSSWSATVELDGERVSLLDERTTATAARDETGVVLVTLEPVEIELAQSRLKVSTWMEFSAEGMRVEREIVTVDGPTAAGITLSEAFKATYGTTEYPEQMVGIVLEAGGQCVNWNDADAFLAGIHASSCHARIPQAGVVVEMEAPTADTTTIDLSTGDLFAPVFELRLTRPIESGERSSTWLRIQRANE